eukprot:CAMPEP_0185834768 /NCGR_PEP_ID=MMETSP1353-20130828/6178_1 /TAXON_ID=1077150 /ORGANISM="Erythrolobus australicus, Strain CCMP3124" /LENGTH=138 /DNA_ID=CAMNT_0028533263 /DNA_START=259 /DNA_END=675 /DNA_ORIENTATION=+
MQIECSIRSLARRYVFWQVVTATRTQSRSLDLNRGRKAHFHGVRAVGIDRGSTAEDEEQTDDRSDKNYIEPVDLFENKAIEIPGWDSERKSSKYGLEFAAGADELKREMRLIMQLKNQMNADDFKRIFLENDRIGEIL